MLMRFVENIEEHESGSRERAPTRLQDFVSVSDSEWSCVASAAMERKLPIYSSWIDFHDGITGDTFDVDRAISDHVLLQKYKYGPLRVPLPYTVSTIELIGGFTEEGDRKLNDYAAPSGQIDKCRDNEKALEVCRVFPSICAPQEKRNGSERNDGSFWWKSTFASTDPKGASDFAIHALGAQRVETPFVHSNADCPVVEWVILPDQQSYRTEAEAAISMEGRYRHPDDLPTGLMLHFVSNPGWSERNLTIRDYAKEQGDIRKLSLDSFDDYMHNYVEFETSSLDPFITRLTNLKVPFIVRRGNKPHYFAIYVNVPNNNLVFKISSKLAPQFAQGLKVDEGLQ